MMQQFVLLRKENDLLKSLIGKSFNEKSKFEAENILDEIHSKAESRMMGKKSLCYIVDQNEIKGVGGSTMMKDKNGKIVSNLVLDQLGKFMAGIFDKSILANRTVSLKDAGGGTFSYSTYSDIGFPQKFNLTSGVPLSEQGVKLQVGQGTTPPVRTDFDLETDFATVPENALFAVTTPVWNSSLGNFKDTGSIVAGGSGTINESILAMIWRTTTGVVKTLILYRDIISPGQSFIAGQSIALEYTSQF